MAGILCSLGFAPAAVPGATIAGVALLLMVLRSAPIRAARLPTVGGVGSVFALSFMGPLIWWMHVVSMGAFLALLIAQALLMTISVIALRSVVTLRAWPLWTAGVWVAVEFVRSVTPFGGFPWGRLAYTVVGTPLESYVRLLGAGATSAVVFLLAVIVASVAPRVNAKTVPIAAGAFGIVLAVGALLPTGTAGPAGTKQVALVQGNVPVIFAPWPPGEIFAMHAAETRKLADAIESGREPSPDLVLWPENSLDVDPVTEPGVSEQIEDLVAQVDAPILVGAIFHGPTSKTAYNAGAVWTPDGPRDRYVKRKVVPFGEYVPFRRQLGRLVPRFSREIPRDMLPGGAPGTIQMAGITIGDTLCWDIAHDNVVRDTITHGASLLVVQTSNASFTGTSQPEQQWQISRLRALETGRTVVVPSTNGISGVIDAKGRVVARAPSQTAAHLSAEVTLGTTITPAVRWGELIQQVLIVLGILGMALATIGWRRSKDVRGGSL